MNFVVGERKKMGRTVDLDAAIDMMKDMYRAAETWGKEADNDITKARAESCMASLVEMKLRIGKLPSAQPEQKFGKWIVMDDDRISGRCSVCGWEAHMYEDDVVGMDYCPNCGAKMEEKDG